MNSYAEQIRNYFKVHWLAMLFAAIPTVLVAIVSIINIFVAFRVDYSELKLTVEADSTKTNTLEQELQTNQDLQNENIAKLVQQGSDQGKQLDIMTNQVDTIYNYVLTR